MIENIKHQISKIKNRKIFFPTSHFTLLTSRKSEGFTLIELLIVIAILGGLAAIFITTFPGAQKKARDANRRSDIKQYQTAMEVYANKNNGQYFTASGNLGTGLNCGSTRLNLSQCPVGSPAYGIRSDLSQYVLFAQLETPNDAMSPPVTQYFYVCSTGKSGLVNEPYIFTTSCP